PAAAGAGALEALEASLQLAERGGDSAQASRLRQRLQELEEANPFTALLWRQQKQVRDAACKVLLGRQEPLGERLEALRSLRNLAMPPAAAAGAEAALQSVLAEVAGPGAAELRGAAEEALWACYCASGDDEIEEKMRRGGALLERRDFKAAVAVFTEVVDSAPDFAEGWNKRATAYYLMQEYQLSLEDCDRVLSLKPGHFGCLSGKGMCHMSLGQGKQAAATFKRALTVHPGMGGALQALDRLDRKGNLQKLLVPRADEVIQAIESNRSAPSSWELGSGLRGDGNDGVAVDWDVHQVAPDGSGGPLTYFFRVGFRNKSIGTVPVRSLGRFYVLRFESGRVFPIMRPTEGAAEFYLEPGEEYRYAWIFSVSQPLAEMHGGMLLDRPSRAATSDRERFVGANLPVLPVSQAPEVGVQHLEVLAEGHVFMGQLDLTQLDK
ncbi:unnamed protein product, partial [Prorocentrum cordatum]